MKNSNPMKQSSNRSFGLVFAGFFVIIGLFPALRGHSIRLWALEIAALFLILAICFPATLKWPNYGWFKLGLMLHKITSPIILGIVFFVVITPIAIIGRLFGKDPLSRKLDRNRKSYWINILPKNSKDSFRSQF